MLMRELIKKILVAIDGSEHAEKALDFALDLAERYSAQVTILNVFQMPTSIYFGEPPMYPVALNNLYDELKSAHHKMLSKALERAKGLKPSLKISTELREGRPADQIVMAAEEGGFDLIVLGHRGLGKVKEFFLGSVSDRVADEARCPVLIVK